MSNVKWERKLKFVIYIQGFEYLMGNEKEKLVSFYPSYAICNEKWKMEICNGKWEIERVIQGF